MAAGKFGIRATQPGTDTEGVRTQSPRTHLVISSDGPETSDGAQQRACTVDEPEHPVVATITID